MKIRRTNRRIGWVVGIAAALVLLGASGRLSPVGWLYDHTLAPAGRSLTAAGTGTGNFLHTLTQVASLARQNDQLKAQNAQLKAQLAALGEVKQENADLRQQVGLNQATGWQVVAANIVAYQPDSYRQFVTLDRGSKSGLVVGQAVTNDGVLVGSVSQVGSVTAKVILVNDPDFRLAVRDQDTGATGILEGQLGAGLVMNQISQTDTVRAGDTVTTSGLGGGMPPGIAIGRVETVNTAENEVFASAAVTPITDVSRLRLVFVVLSL